MKDINMKNKETKSEGLKILRKKLKFKTEKKFFNYLSVRTAIVIALVILITAGVTTSISYSNFSKISDKGYEESAGEVAKTSAALLDGDIIADYATTRERDDKYFEMLDCLCRVYENTNVMYLYVQVIDGGNAITIMDTDPENPMEFREVNPVSDGFDVTDLDNIPAFFVKDETTNGNRVCSVFKPVKNSAGENVALVGVDISADEMQDSNIVFLRSIATSLILLVVLLIAISAFIIEKSIVDPIQYVSNAAKTFVDNNSMERDAEPIKFEQKKIGQIYEINDLKNSILSMQQDIQEYIENLTKVTSEKERIDTELNVATKIQASMLPSIFPAFPDRQDFDIYASMNPAKEVGGDFYDFFLIDDNHLGIVMADVSGKGVPAALFMMIGKTLLKNRCQISLSPAEILHDVNNQLCENNETELFVTVWLGILDIRTGTVTAANAGHEFPAIMHKGGKYELLNDKHGFVLAGMPDMKYKEYTIQLDEGDKLFLYTDGVPEATNADNELFGTDRMIEALNSKTSASAEETLKIVESSVDGFVKDAPQFDDLTMLCLEYKKKAEHD